MQLVGFYEKRLQVPRKEALWRLIGSCVVLTFLLFFVTGWLYLFPWSAGSKDQVALLTENPTRVESILDGDVIVSGEQITKLAPGNLSLVAVNESKITYLVVRDGIKYKHFQTAESGWAYDIHNREISNGVLHRDLTRSPVVILSSLMFVALVLLLVWMLQIIFSSVEEDRFFDRKTKHHLFLG